MKKTITHVIVFICAFHCHAQSNTPCVINAAGGSFQSGYYQFEWSLGEMALIGEMNNPDNSLIVTNGFIQPLIDFPAKYYINHTFRNDEIKIFPNPASDYIEINFLTNQTGRISINLFDGVGRKIYSSSELYYGTGLIRRMPVQHLPDQIYFLHIDLDDYQGLLSKKGVYKIIKIK